MSTLDSLGSLKSYISSTLKQLPKKTPAYNDLHRLRDVVVDLEILIYHPSYKSRQDSEHINSRISQIARLTRSDLQDFNALIQPSATPDRSRLRSSRDRILAHEDAFARLLDLIEGREDWQKLSPREPPAQLALTAGPSSSGAPSSARDSNSENASPRVSVSVPASPFQPTVEDCDDDTDEDAPQPAHYHLIRSDSDAATIRERPTQNANSPQPPPPTVVVRSATLISESDLPSTPQPQNPSPTSSINERLHPSQTPSPSAPSPSRSPAGSSRGRPPRAHHASIDRGTPTHADDYPHDDHQRRRKRASTASGLERPDREPRDRDREPRDRDLRDREPRDRDREARDRGREPRDRDRDPHDRDRDRDSRTDHSRTSSYAQTTPRHSPRSGPENALSRRSSQRSNVAAHRSPSAHYPPIPGAYPEGSNYWDAPEPTAGGEWGRSSSASSSSAAGVQGSSSKYGPDPRASLPTVLERGRAMPLSPRGGMASLSYPDDLPAGGGGLYDMPAAAGTQYVDFIGAGDFTLFDTPARTRSSSGRGGYAPPPGGGVPPVPPLPAGVGASVGSLPPPPQGNQPVTSPAAASSTFSPRGRMADSPSPLAQGEETGPMIKQLPVSLEDLFYGTKVRVTFRRKVWEEKRRRWTEEEHDVEVPIYKGLKPGSRVKFRGEGDIGPGGVERDLHFVVVERSHPTFTRHSLDLHCTLDVPLADALCGWSLTMTSICGKAVTVSHPGPTPTGWIERRTGLGMCDYRRPEERGDLVLEVHVVWPEGQLGEGQKKMVRAALKDL